MLSRKSLADDVVPLWCTYFDELVLRQEEAYLTNPRLFSRCGKFKSMPWRMAIVMTDWEIAAQMQEAVDKRMASEEPPVSKQDFFFYLCKERDAAWM